MKKGNHLPNLNDVQCAMCSFSERCSANMHSINAGKFNMEIKCPEKCLLCAIKVHIYYTSNLILWIWSAPVIFRIGQDISVMEKCRNWFRTGFRASKIVENPFYCKEEQNFYQDEQKYRKKREWLKESVSLNFIVMESISL